MQSNKKIEPKKRSLGKRLLKIFLIIVGSFVGLVIIILLLIQTGPVQNFARKKIVTYLENKLKTRVAIAGLDIDFPKILVLKGVYIEDQLKDTLVSGKEIKVDIDMFKLVKGAILINEINLNKITLKLKRSLPDTTFNFQFIVNVFSSPDAAPSTDTSSLSIAIRNIVINKTRIVFKDVVSGNDADVYLDHFDTRIASIDLEKLAFNIPSINLSGVRGSIKQFAPLYVTTTTEEPIDFSFANGSTKLADINLQYENEVNKLSTNIDLKKTSLTSTSFNLLASFIDIKSVAVNGLSTAVVLGKPTTPITTADSIATTDSLPWKIKIGDITIDNNNLSFDNALQPAISMGMDYAHLRLSGVALHLNDFYFANNIISGQVTKGTLADKSGFILTDLQTKFSYTSTGVALNGLLVKTPGTTLQKSAVISYPSLAALQTNSGLMQLNVDLADSKVRVKDILLLAPFLAGQPALKNPNDVWYIDGKITGRVSNLYIEKFKFSGLGSTRLNMSGTVAGLPDPNKVSGNLLINNFYTTRKDIQMLAPPGTIPSNISLPATMALKGRVNGSIKQAMANLTLTTDLGIAKLQGNIANATDMVNARYNASMQLNRINLGIILQKPDTLGIFTGNLQVKGRGFNPDKANVTFNGTIEAVELIKYTYRDIRLKGSLAQQQFTANMAINDANIDLDLEASGHFGNDLPGIKLLATIDSIKTKPLNLTADEIIYRGKLAVDFPQINPDALEGKAFVTNSLLVFNGGRTSIDSLSLLANYVMGVQSIKVDGRFFNADITGKYKIVQLGNIFSEIIQPYYTIDTSAKVTFPDPYDFTIKANLVNHPALKTFVPDLTRLDPVSLNVSLAQGNGLQGTLTAPFVAVGTNVLQNFTANFAGDADQLKIAAGIQKFAAGTNVTIYQTDLISTINNNEIDFGLSIKDQKDQRKYLFGGTLSQASLANYRLHLNSDSLLLNYEKWNITSQNLIEFGTQIVRAKNFTLSQNNQSLSINSKDSTSGIAIEVRFANFEIPTLTALVQTDSLLANGKINGTILLDNLLTSPTFTTDISVDDLAINRDTLGKLTAKIDNQTANIFNTNITLTGQGNDVSITGRYLLESASNENLDLLLDVKKLQMKSLEGPSFGAVSNTSGYLSGKIDIGGNADAPKIDGSLDFNQTEFKLSMVNSLFKVNDEKIKFDNDGITFNTFSIKDSAGNAVTLDGRALTNNFLNYKFNLTLKAKDFRAINSTRANNELYYGQLYFSSELNIKGTETAPIVDGSIDIEPKTNLSIVIPQEEPGIIDRQGVIEFIDKDAIKEDSLFMVATMAKYDTSFNQSQLTGFDVSTNIQISKEAIFNIIVDEANGDFLKLKGEGVISAGVDPSGKISMTGTYTVESGGYELSFNFLKRKFEIEKGGKITWTGEPTTGTIDMTAIYVANTAPIDLVQNQLPADTKNSYLQKLPFQVRLNVDGELLKPSLTFDITLPTDRNLRVSGDVVSTVTAKLDQIRTEPSELNKQVFALLLLNRFVGEDPFSSGGGGGFDAGIYARQSVSRILTEQLNKLASDLVGGIEISFDINTTEDYTTQQKQARTDLNVNLSKRLLNDRLQVSVGSNVELEGPQQSDQTASNIIGNVTIDYLLTKDGRFLLRGYRKNDFEAIVEGIVVETGLRFIITVDYNKFKEIFTRKKDPKKNAGDKKQTNNVSAPATLPQNDNNTGNNAPERAAGDKPNKVPELNKKP